MGTEKANQLDFFDKIETHDMKLTTLFRKLHDQIHDLSPNAYLSDQTICCNLLAWSLYCLDSAYNDLMYALEVEELPSNSSINNLKLAVETLSVSDWIDKNPEWDPDMETWGEFEPIRSLASRCRVAEYIQSIVRFHLLTQTYTPDYLQQDNNTAFNWELENPIEIYQPNTETELEQKEESRQNLENNFIQDLREELNLESDVVFGMAIGCFLTVFLFLLIDNL